MITSQNLLTDPIPGWPALTTSGKTPLGRRFAEVLTPPVADVIGGTEPTLLTPGPRLGLGSQLGARDNLHADVDEDGSIRLVFGNFEGEVQRASVDAAGTMQIDWTRRVGYQAFALAQVDDDTMFFATDEGRAGLIDIPTGNLLTITAPGHVGTRPRRPIVGPAYDDNGVATELIFLTNSQLEILGLDPQTLDVVYRNATIGTFEDWAFTSPLAGNKRAWIALTRGHLVLVEFDLAGCVEVVAMTPPLNDLPKKILVAGEHAMVSDSQGTHVFDPQGNELPPPPGSYFFDTCLKVDEEGKVIPPRPDIMRIVPNTTWLLWQDGHCVGVTDLFEIDFENPGPPVAPLAKVENVHRMLSLAAAGGRYFATTPTQVLELVPVPSSTPGQFTIQKNPLNLPTGGTIAMSEDTATGDVMMIHLLEPPGAPPAGFDGSLLRVDPTNPGSPVIIEGSGYLYWDSSLAWHGGAAYLTWEGTLLDVAGQPVAFSPMSLPEPKERLEPDRTEGHFFAMPDFLPASDMGVTPPAFFAYPYGPGKLKNAKVTTNMPGIANRGASTVHRLGADGVYRVYVSTAGGRVFLFKVDAQTGLPLSGGEPDAESIDLGWKAVGLTTGVYQPVAGDRGQDQDVVFAGTWLSHQQLTGHVYVLDAETLDVIKVLGTGIGSLGIRQVDLEGDGLYELLVGTFASFQVWRAQGADFVQAWKGELGSMGYGAYNHIFVKENTAGQVEQIFTSTTGGLKVFDVTLPGTTAE